MHVGVGSNGDAHAEFDPLLRAELLCPPAHHSVMEFVADRALEVGRAAQGGAGSATARRARFTLQDLCKLDSENDGKAAELLADALLYFGALALE